MQFLMDSTSASALEYFLRPGSALVSSSQIFVSGFRGSIDVLIKPSFTNFVSTSIYLQAILFASIYSSRHLRLSCAGRKIVHCGRKGPRPERNRLSGELFEALMAIRCNEGDV